MEASASTDSLSACLFFVVALAPQVSLQEHLPSRKPQEVGGGQTDTDVAMAFFLGDDGERRTLTPAST